MLPVVLRYPVAWFSVLTLCVSCSSSSGDELFGPSTRSVDAGSGVDVPNAGGAAGQAGTSGAGGDAASGGRAGSGTAGQGGKAGASGSAGHGGQPPPPDCRSACPSFCTSGSNMSATCKACAEAQCHEQRQALESAPQITQFQSCLGRCGSEGCADECCASHPQACHAVIVFLGCLCGYENTSCTTVCQEACDGGPLNPSCHGCLWHSPCGDELYRYTYAPEARNYSECWLSCTDPSCRDVCCANFPDPCEARKQTLACACAP
jgi:hypothetical protein